MLHLHVTPLPCPQWDMSQPGSRTVPPPTRKVSCFGFSWTLRSISLITPPLTMLLFVRSCWLSVGIIKDTFTLVTAATLQAGIRLTRMVSCPQPLSELGCASHARPETMTETLRLSKFPGKVSSWAWDWEVRGKDACGEKEQVNMPSVRARSQSSILV